MKSYRDLLALATVDSTSLWLIYHLTSRISLAKRFMGLPLQIAPCGGIRWPSNIAEGVWPLGQSGEY